jgi:hypothetical protein
VVQRRVQQGTQRPFFFFFFFVANMSPLLFEDLKTATKVSLQNNQAIIMYNLEIFQGPRFAD